MVNKNALRVALAERNLSQWRLAKRLRIHPSTFSDYIRGARPAPPDLIKRIAHEVGISSTRLAAGEDVP